MVFLDKVLVILVLYKQDLGSSLSLVELNDYLSRYNQVMDLFVYDNSPQRSYESEFIFGKFNVKYLHDPSNSGVSRAYNKGAYYAETLNKEFVFLLDQDTVFPSNFIVEYGKSIVLHPDCMIYAPILKTQFGEILSPSRYQLKRGIWLSAAVEGYYDSHSHTIINSGMMIRLAAFFAVGGYNERVRLDFADFQFIERFSQMFKSFYIINLVCNQHFSGFETDKEKLKHRFEFFCEGARNCQKRSLSDHFWYFIAVTRRMAGLILKTGDISYLRIFLSKYW